MANKACIARTRHTHRSVFNQGDSYTGSPGPDFFRNLEAGMV